MRIHIIGGPGSGKTTLGQAIAARFHIPHHDLDRMFNDPEAISMAFDIAQQANWVTENIGLVWVDPLLYWAEYIVLLEVSWPVAAWRIVTRHISKSLRGINPYPTRLLIPFLKDTHSFYLSKVSPYSPVAEAIHLYLEEQAAMPDPPDEQAIRASFEQCKATIPLSAEFMRIYLAKYKEKVIVIENNTDRERLFDLLSTSNRM